MQSSGPSRIKGSFNDEEELSTGSHELTAEAPTLSRRIAPMLHCEHSLEQRELERLLKLMLAGHKPV
jgi:hypothetical protein